MKAKMFLSFLICLMAMNARALCWATRLDPICPKPKTISCKAKYASGGQFAINYDEQTQSLQYNYEPTVPCNPRSHRWCPGDMSYKLNSADQAGFEGKVHVQPEQLHLQIGDKLDLQLQTHEGKIAISNLNYQGVNLPADSWECNNETDL